jgi:cell division septum initiation protein DivIVA
MASLAGHHGWTFDRQFLPFRNKSGISRAHWREVQVMWNRGEIMLSFEIEPDQSVTPTVVEDVPDEVADTETEPNRTRELLDVTTLVAPAAVEESPATAAARMLEAAVGTAGQLVADAKSEAESLVATARATADEILEGLGEEKTALEAQIATLRQLLGRHSTQMRDLLTHQLSLLEAAAHEPDAIALTRS